jgi:cytidylate kinase
MVVITISRELGSEGDKIADLLCEELGFCRVDKAMLMQIAEDAGVDSEAVLAAERDFVRKPRLVSSDMTSLYRKQPGAFGKSSAVDEQTYVQVLQDTMQSYAAQGNAVIVGRGGQMVLRDWPTALHVHLYAPEGVRAKRLMQRSDITEAQAKARIKRSDETKRQYIRYMHANASWKNMRYYHLAIDTGAVDPEVAARIILNAAASREESKEGGEPAP